jgi:hypothetical protein
MTKILQQQLWQLRSANRARQELTSGLPFVASHNTVYEMCGITSGGIRSLCVYGWICENNEVLQGKSIGKLGEARDEVTRTRSVRHLSK